MKNRAKIVLLLLSPLFAQSQQSYPDSLRNILQHAANDSMRYVAERELYNFYEESNRDSALYYAEQSLLLGKKYNKKLVQARGLDIKAYQLLLLGRYAESLECLLEAFKIAEDPANDKEETWRVAAVESPGKSRLLLLALTHHMYGILMAHTQNTEQQIFHFGQARRIALDIGNKFRLLLADMNLGNSYLIADKPDSAFFFASEAERISKETGLRKYLGSILTLLGDLYLRKGDKEMARQYYYTGLQTAREQKTLSSVILNNGRLIDYYRNEQEKDSVLKYALDNLQVMRSMGAVIGTGTEQGNNIGTAYENVYRGYVMNNQPDSAFKYQGLALSTKDSLYKVRIKTLAEFQNLSLNEQRRLQNLEKEKVLYRNKVRTYGLVAGLAIFLLIALILYRNNHQKQKANKELQSTLASLKATQAQLIQSEKMASLGELTAGIAHEIQNPLNFVNNFSEVSNELIAEMNDELDKGSITEAKAIASDIQQNLEKINHHGKRADAIVKGMLQHSRSSSGIKESTDINALVDEYLRLAYHGLRAKDKSFNATLKTDYDKKIGPISIISQDIGRVVLNLITNAFYAVGEKKKTSLAEQDAPFDPTVAVSTKKINNKIEIKVADNGSGIPSAILDKIFHPFFTTKPTGQGTGLGLSLAYDIVKAHGGELKVETNEGKGTAFTIILNA
jgi:signal transduction histidine kinase